MRMDVCNCKRSLRPRAYGVACAAAGRWFRERGGVHEVCRCDWVNARKSSRCMSMGGRVLQAIQ
jgi:hypothetical protein